jgi:Mn-containing catalase
MFFHKQELFSYHDGPTSTAPMPRPTVKTDPRLYGTTPNPIPVEKVTAKVKDVLGA